MAKTSSMKLSPVDMAGMKKREMRTQFAALCWRVHKDQVQVLLVTSRNTKRWIIPKGWPMDGETAADAAATEAWEEAGVIGRVGHQCAGIYTYQKDMGDHKLPVVVAVFPLRMKKQKKDFPEAGDRKVRWVKRSKAASLVAEPELRGLIKNFRPLKK